MDALNYVYHLDVRKSNFSAERRERYRIRHNKGMPKLPDQTLNGRVERMKVSSAHKFQSYGLEFLRGKQLLEMSHSKFQ